MVLKACVKNSCVGSRFLLILFSNSFNKFSLYCIRESILLSLLMVIRWRSRSKICIILLLWFIHSISDTIRRFPFSNDWSWLQKSKENVLLGLWTQFQTTSDFVQCCGQKDIIQNYSNMGVKFNRTNKTISRISARDMIMFDFPLAFAPYMTAEGRIRSPFRG